MLNRLRDFISSVPLNRNVLTLVGLFVILAAIPLTVYLSQHQQELRQRAESRDECRSQHKQEYNACIQHQEEYNSCINKWEKARADCHEQGQIDCDTLYDYWVSNECDPLKGDYNYSCWDKLESDYAACDQIAPPTPTPQPTEAPFCSGSNDICINENGICVPTRHYEEACPSGGAHLVYYERAADGYCWYNTSRDPCPPPTPTVGGRPTPPGGGPTCPQQTCSYTTADSSCPSGVAECFGNGVSGFNVPGCNYQGCLNKGGGIGGCTCVAAGGGVIATPTPTPTIRPGVPTPTTQPGQPSPTKAQTAPTPTSTPIPTATPIPPTPTIPAGATALVVNVRQQVLASPPRNNSRQLEVKIFNTQNQEIKSENVNAPFQNGIFTATLNLGNNFATSPYVVKVKISNTLRKLMQNVTNITAGQTNTLSTVGLLSGDVNNDNELSVVDYAVLLGCVELPGKPVVCNNRSAADLNDDGNVTIQDLGILISNFSHRKGD